MRDKIEDYRRENPQQKDLFHFVPDVKIDRDECDCSKIATQRYKDLEYEIEDGSCRTATIYIEYCNECGKIIGIHQKL